MGGVQKRINVSPLYKKAISLCGFRETFGESGGVVGLFPAILVIVFEPLDGGLDTLLDIGELEFRVGLA